MTESPEHDQSTATPTRRPDDHRSGGLYRALAWVGITAGTLFIVATVFFSGYVLGTHNDGAGKRSGCPGHHRMLMQPPGQGMKPEKPAQRGEGQGPRSARLTPPPASVAPPSPSP